MKFLITGIMLLSLLSCAHQTDNSGVPAKTALNGSIEETSYAMGVDIGSSLRMFPTMIDIPALVQGIVDTLQEHPRLLSDEKLAEIMAGFSSKMQEAQKAQSVQAAVDNKKKGAEFLAENMKRPEVTVTGTGLQYEVLKQGSGPHPELSDEVRIHYKGEFLDSTEFDSSWKRGEPVTIPLSGVIPGWSEGVQLMNVGSKYRFYIPGDLGYGEAGAPPVIGPYETLIFEVELLEIIK